MNGTLLNFPGTWPYPMVSTEGQKRWVGLRSGMSEVRSHGWWSASDAASGSWMNREAKAEQTHPTRRKFGTFGEIKQRGYLAFSRNSYNFCAVWE